MRIYHKFIFFLLIIFLTSCIHSGGSRFQLPTEARYYIINSYTSSEFINNIVQQLQSIKWNIDVKNSTKEEAIYYLNEAIIIKDNKLCAANKYSDIVINNLAIDYKIIDRIEVITQPSGRVYFYDFSDRNVADKISVEIRKIKGNEFTILCGVSVD